MDDYNTVYQASWKATENFAGFVGSFARRLSLLGYLRLAILYVGAVPVAAQVWVVTHNKASIFRLVYDEQWKLYSPGSILTQYLMEYVIVKDKVTHLDFLTGNEKYKQDWMSVRQERWAINFVKLAEPLGRGGLLIKWAKNLIKV